MEKATSPQVTQNSQLNQIVELEDGTVVIQFDHQRSVRISPNKLGRSSDVTSQCSLKNLHKPIEPSRWSVQSRIESSVIGVHEEPEGVSVPIDQPTSPTPSDMGYANICVLTESKMSKERLKQMFESDKNHGIREWFFLTFTEKQRSQFYKEYTFTITRLKLEIDFFIFLRNYLKLKNLKVPEFREPQVNTLEKISQEFTLAKGEKVNSIHPPDATVQIQKDVLAVPYKSISKNLSEPVSIGAINQVVEQNNYTNLYLQTLGKQLTRLERQESRKGETSYSGDVTTKIQLVILKHPPDISKFKIGREPEFLYELITRLSDLNLSEKSTSITTLSGAQRQIEDFIKGFLKEPDPSINKMTYAANTSQPDLKPYYPRPSPVDLQFEDEIWHGASYDGGSIVEWNIDGLSEYQILRLVKNILIYASACKLKRNGDPEVANAIIAC